MPSSLLSIVPTALKISRVVPTMKDVIVEAGLVRSSCAPPDLRLAVTASPQPLRAHAAGPRRNAERNIRGDKRSNEPHSSTADPDGRLYRKANDQLPQLCFMGYLLEAYSRVTLPLCALVYEQSPVSVCPCLGGAKAAGVSPPRLVCGRRCCSRSSMSCCRFRGHRC